MRRDGSVEITPDQWRAAYWGLSSVDGDPEVLEDLGYPMTIETVRSHVESAAEVAAALKAAQPPDPHEGLTGKALFRAVRLELAQRQSS